MSSPDFRLNKAFAQLNTLTDAQRTKQNSSATNAAGSAARIGKKVL